MPKTLRPSPQSFRDAGWLPKSKAAYDLYMKNLSNKIQSGIYKTADDLLPPVREFKNFIESEPTVYGEFIRMFDNITESPKDYNELLNMLNEIFREAPAFGDLGPPMYMIMARIMNTEGGFSAFTKDNLNRHFKKMFETWSLFLTSKDSRTVLNDSENGWLSSKAKDAMMKEYPGHTFEEVFICDPQAEFYGYTSYDDFFNRPYRNAQDVRPTGDLKDNSIICNPCESTSYAYQENVKAMDELFIKDEAYSLHHLLAGNHVDQFVGGTILQGFLNTTGYHRWHAPVNGTIQQIVDVSGTYFAQAPYMIGKPTDDENEVPPYLQSLQYFSNTAARKLIFIQPDDDRIGLMCFIGVGMTEISTCRATVYEGQHVVRGDELGMFHFGGSSCVLVFTEGSQVRIDDEYKEPGIPLRINEPIGAVPK